MDDVLTPVTIDALYYMRAPRAPNLHRADVTEARCQCPMRLGPAEDFGLRPCYCAGHTRRAPSFVCLECSKGSHTFMCWVLNPATGEEEWKRDWS